MVHKGIFIKTVIRRTCVQFSRVRILLVPVFLSSIL